jgi:poly(glycerol-phosphate) alpha-glucosyltransferase
MLSAACLHALNHKEAASLRDIGLLNPIAIIPNGVDLPSRVSKPCLLPPRLAGDDRQTLLFLGRINKKKGVAQLIDAWAHLLALAPQVRSRWRLVIAGWDDGGELEKAKKRMREHRLEQDISFPGPLFGEEKDAALRYASGFILPSNSEGLPVAVLEAWSFKKAVFMTEECNLSEAFGIGCAVEIPRNSIGMAEVLAKYLMAEAQLQQIGARGFNFARERYIWSEIGKKYLETYIWLARGGQRPAHVEVV